VQRRREEVAQGTEEVIPISLHVTERALEDFHRAKTIAEGKAERNLTQGQVFGILADTYLDVYDEERVKPGKRRMPHTSLVKGRSVPAEVKREIAARQGRKCAVPYCDHDAFLNYAHVGVPHRNGGSREARDLIRACKQHHDLLDAGYIKMTGTAANPRFTDRECNDLSKRVGECDDHASKSSTVPKGPPGAKEPAGGPDPP
jgi:hypothetical protein